MNIANLSDIVGAEIKLPLFSFSEEGIAYDVVNHSETLRIVVVSYYGVRLCRAIIEKKKDGGLKCRRL